MDSAELAGMSRLLPSRPSRMLEGLLAPRAGILRDVGESSIGLCFGERNWRAMVLKKPPMPVGVTDGLEVGVPASSSARLVGLILLLLDQVLILLMSAPGFRCSVLSLAEVVCCKDGNGGFPRSSDSETVFETGLLKLDAIFGSISDSDCQWRNALVLWCAGGNFRDPSERSGEGSSCLGECDPENDPAPERAGASSREGLRTRFGIPVLRLIHARGFLLFWTTAPIISSIRPVAFCALGLCIGSWSHKSEMSEAMRGYFTDARDMRYPSFATLKATPFVVVSPERTSGS
mmetsp:Transcript_41858/g.99363  ORF Transcript_41858/g.99363 Transcript_41858/m.99363 type:complete len:290 (-) Transcript_41858:1094-1963(-)